MSFIKVSYSLLIWQKKKGFTYKDALHNFGGEVKRSKFKVFRVGDVPFQKSVHGFNDFIVVVQRTIL